MPSVAVVARRTLTVCLIRSTQSRAEARLGLLVQVADLRTQVLDDGFEPRTRLKKFQALGNERGHRFRASFLNLAGGPVVQFLPEGDADWFGRVSVNGFAAELRAGGLG